MSLRSDSREPAVLLRARADLYVQVFDLIDSLGLPRKWAKHLEARRIKQLAHLWAGSAQSYPQTAWKALKVSINQQLAAAPSGLIEQSGLNACQG